jgi:putative phosphoribosyl transferase
MLFVDRRDAGRKLARKLGRFRGEETVVLALPRGGIPVGYEVARQLGAPLEVFVVRKLGAPGHEELAMGAIASGGAVVFNEEVIEALGISQEQIQNAAIHETAELRRREARYRRGRPLPNLRGRTVLIVDDGLATGSTMRAAVLAVRELDPARVVVAVPVGAAQTCQAMSSEADDVICVATPEPFYGVGRFYFDFSQTSDEEVVTLLEAAGTPVLAS